MILGQHVPLIRWTEATAKRALWERCGADPDAQVPGRCEGCGAAGGLDPSHRVRAARGGLWDPCNLIALCRTCHDQLHARPLWALALGWELPGSADPQTEPAWLLHQLYGWGRYLLTVADDGTGIRRHLAVPVSAVWVP